MRSPIGSSAVQAVAVVLTVRVAVEAVQTALHGSRTSHRCRKWLLSGLLGNLIGIIISIRIPLSCSKSSWR